MVLLEILLRKFMNPFDNNTLPRTYYKELQIINYNCLFLRPYPKGEFKKTNCSLRKHIHAICSDFKGCKKDDF